MSNGDDDNGSRDADAGAIDSAADSAADDGVSFDVWVCQGRLCRSHGADDISAACAHALMNRDDDRARLLRGGCYGLCDLGANVVVRRYEGAREDSDSDRLSLTDSSNEFVSCGVTAADVPELLGSFLDDDQPLVRLSRMVKEAEQPPRSTIEARMRALREKRRAAGR